jgi:hypothetical protein
MVGLAIHSDESEQRVWNHDWNLPRKRENYRFKLQEGILAWKLYFYYPILFIIYFWIIIFNFGLF